MFSSGLFFFFNRLQKSFSLSMVLSCSGQEQGLSELLDSNPSSARCFMSKLFHLPKLNYPTGKTGAIIAHGTELSGFNESP